MSSAKAEGSSGSAVGSSQSSATSTTGDPAKGTAADDKSTKSSTTAANAEAAAAAAAGSATATEDGASKSSTTTTDDAAADTKSSAPSSAAANCYCAQERSVGSVELLCATCNKWFHERCISVPLGGKLIPFASNYVFFCKACTPSGVESFRRCQASRCPNRIYFHIFILHLWLPFCRTD